MKLTIGFITYENLTAKYLPFFLPSLTTACLNCNDEIKIVAIDNSKNKNNKNTEFIKLNYPKIEIKSLEKNIGFARAYNKMIKKASIENSKYFLMLNPDTILEPSAIKEMIVKMEKNQNLSSVSPRIFKFYLYKNNNNYQIKKTNIIDTYGIKLHTGLRFRDLGENQVDNNQFKNKKIIGPSGAAGMYRMDALEKIKQKNEQYFDEEMFMYKEDCDLAYRLFLAGFESCFVDRAIVYHNRTGAGVGRGNLKTAWNRIEKSKQVKKWSFLNQHIIFIKYWHLQNWKNKLAIIWYELKVIIFILIFEQYLLLEYKKIFKYFLKKI